MIPPNRFADAVALACPGRPFACSGSGYDSLRMNDGGEMPTLEEIETAWRGRRPERLQPTVEQLVKWLSRNMSDQQLEEAAKL